MNVLIFTPAPAGSTRGNRVTAERWAGLLRQAGHHVTIIDDSHIDSFSGFAESDCPDCLIAMHAFRSAGVVNRFQQAFPDRPIAVCLTGTDMSRDLLGAAGPEAQQTALATAQCARHIICLESASCRTLPEALREKARVIYQSAVPSPAPDCSRTDVFEVCVVGHLRPVKDPLLIVRALCHLPASSRVGVLHLGEALDEGLRRMAEQAAMENPRYVWMGGQPHPRCLQILARCRAMVLTSRSESAPSVISEAVVSSVPVLATRIPGVVGLLGENYPGLFRVGDASELAGLLGRAEGDQSFLNDLNQHLQAIRTRFDPEQEKAALVRLLADLSGGPDA